MTGPDKRDSGSSQFFAAPVGTESIDLRGIAKRGLSEKVKILKFFVNLLNNKEVFYATLLACGRIVDYGCYVLFAKRSCREAQ